MTDGRVDYIYRYKVKADPLLAVDFKYIDKGTDKTIKEAMYAPSAEQIRDDDFHSLKDKIMDSSPKKILKDGVSFELTISGGFKFQYEVAYNYTQDTLLFYDVSANRTFPASQRDFDFESFI